MESSKAIGYLSPDIWDCSIDEVRGILNDLGFALE